jgi:hypothetical protein
MIDTTAPPEHTIGWRAAELLCRPPVLRLTSSTAGSVLVLFVGPHRGAALVLLVVGTAAGLIRVAQDVVTIVG